MRIDREAFFVALAALAGASRGCERASTTEQQPLPPPPAPHPAIAMPRPAPPPPAPEPVATPEPAPPPVRTVNHLSPKRWFLSLTVEQRTHVTSVCERRAHDSCRAALEELLVRRDAPRVVPPAPATDPDAKDLASLSTGDRARVASYCERAFTPPSCETPLVVAFDSQPIEFVPAATARFAFVPGAPAATDWPSAATPWIALDLDGDGSITSGAELFGSSTVLPGGSRATNGFAALAVLDANGDGVLDARDPMFAKLVLWSDRDGDHRSSPDELRPLSSVVTQIPLAFTRDPRCNDSGDCEGERGALHWRDAAGADHAGAVVDVYIPSK